VAETRYLPYGEERWTAGGAQPTDFTFTGQRVERGFGLMDYRARYYDPRLGRFISADAVVPEPGNPQAWNRYAYVYNNPLRYNDPSGHQGEPWWEIAIQTLKQSLDAYLVPEHDASVVSAGVTGGASVVGLGIPLHSTVDIVSNQEGQVQVFYTHHTDYYLAHLTGNEGMLEFVDERLEGDWPHPQDDVTIFPQASVGVSTGNADGGRLSSDIQEWGGYADVFGIGVSGPGIGPGASASMAHGYDPDPDYVYEYGHKLPVIDDVWTRSSGLGFGVTLSPVSPMRYGTRSIPAGPQFDLPDQLIDVCKGVGGCGNEKPF
jgi:RHS repeat-associated protein